MGYYKLRIVFIILLLLSFWLSILAANKMKDRTLKKILKGKNKFQKNMIVRTYFAIMIPLIIVALFGAFIWLLSQLLRP